MFFIRVLARLLWLCAKAITIETITRVKRFIWWALRLPRPPWPGDSSVSVAWLQSVLQRSGSLRPSDTVSTIQCSNIKGNRGLVGALSRLTVAYNVMPPAAESAPAMSAIPPASLILKTNRHGMMYRIGGVGGGQFREAFLYTSTDVLQRMPAGLVPRCFYGTGDSLFGEYCMLIEDCSVGGVLVNELIADPLVGGPAPSLSSAPLALAALTAVFERAADLHAAFWNESSLLKKVLRAVY